MDDPWKAAGTRASAMLSRGDESGREELLARAGRHPEALEALVRTEKKIGSPHFDRDLAILLRVAPGARVTGREEQASSSPSQAASTRPWSRRREPWIPHPIAISRNAIERDTAGLERCFVDLDESESREIFADFKKRLRDVASRPSKDVGHDAA